MKLGTILIRADASPEIGTGHVMRCLALAQAWQDAGGDAVFALAESTPSVASRLKAESFEHVCIRAARGSAEDADSTVALARSREAKWIVLDGYRFDAQYQDGIKRCGARVLLIDDAGAQQPCFADVILNQNLGAAEEMYIERSSRTRLLLGTEFVLLRREFRKYIDLDRVIPAIARRVLVTLGGSDPTATTARILREGGFSGLATTVLFGGSAREPPRSLAGSGIEVLKDMPDTASLMTQADITVICGGGTLWESLFMGCATLSYARNRVQEAIMRRLHEMGAAHWLGDIGAFDWQALAAVVNEIASSYGQRSAMCADGRKIVDGRGAERVARALQEIT